MAKNPTTTTTQDTSQQFDQQQTQQQNQNQQQLQAQQSATQNLQQMMESFLSSSTQAQNTTNQQGSTATGTQTTGLSAVQQPVIQKYFDDLMSKYTGGTLAPQAYGGDRVAQLTPEQLQAQQMAGSYATGAGTDFTNQALKTGGYLLDPNQILNPANIPGLQATKDANATALTRNLTENQLPMIRNEALLTGGYGGSRQGIAEGLATGRTNEAIINANAGMDMNAYNSGLGAMMQSLGLAPQTANLGTQPANVIGQIGAQNQAQNQANITANQQQFNEQQAAQGNILPLLQQLMGTSGQYGGTTTNQQTGQQTGQQGTTATGTQQGTSQQMQLGQQLAQMLGINVGEASETGSSTASGASSGHSTGKQVNDPGFIAKLGAIASIAMMPFTLGGSSAGIAAASDRRLKSNIRQIGKTAAGLGVYSYTMDGKPGFGVIAQEVIPIFPEAVFIRSDGYYMVDYSRIG